ncbi:MAG: ATP synthase F1 subunit epsilon [Alphaproteobacteria bacterium]|nr:ATP synthase F1 subunit epsilon [Alphaproteobacteria bacterium]
MATTLDVKIVTPEKRVFDGQASEIVLPAWEGELGVYPDHDSLLTLLRSGSCKLVTASGVQTWVVGRGFAEIGGSSVTILTSSCVAASEVDKAKAQADLTAAEAELGGAEFGSEKLRQAQIMAENARARLDA